MKLNTALSRLSGLFGVLGKILIALVLCGILYLMYILRIWLLPMGLIELAKSEPWVAGTFGVIFVISIIAIILIHRKSSSG